MIKDCKTIIAVEVNNNHNNQSNIITKEHRLYVAALIINEKLDRTWYIDTRGNNIFVLKMNASQILKFITIFN